MTMLPEERKEFLDAFDTSRWTAHHLLFKKRHPEESPEFHREIIERFHDGHARDLVMAFRGGGKSTLAEETIIIKALFGEFKNGIIVGSSYERAVERLRTIKHELENNDLIIALFGEQMGATWTENRIVLANGSMLQAYGRGQSLRGAKHLDTRPDFCLVDDFEEEDSVRTEESKSRTMSWFMAVLLPAMNPKAKIVVVGTPLDYDSVLVKLSKEREWRTLTFPIEHINQGGERKASWPDRFPLNEIDIIRDRYERMGKLREYAQEYLCKAEEESEKAFNPAMFKVEPRPRSWEPVYIMLDPARTVGPKSAHTGVGAWSWIGNRLHVWDAFGGFLRPDEIIKCIFDLNDRYNPVEIGVEEDGLNEFLMQPIRQEIAKRGLLIPIKAIKAPKGKLDFIKGLQPFFNAGEVTFQNPFPDLQSQLLNFPTGRIDVPNALAYALKIGKGISVYEEFSQKNITQNPTHGKTFLILGYDNLISTGALVTYSQNTIHIVKDYAVEGELLTSAIELLQLASLDQNAPYQIILEPHHFDTYRGSGLPAKLQRFSLPVIAGGDPEKGREMLKELMMAPRKDGYGLQVSALAPWTLRALSGGYHYPFDKRGQGQTEATRNQYRALMEAIESFAGNLQSVTRSLQEGMEDDNIQYDYTKSGRKFISAMPR